MRQQPLLSSLSKHSGSSFEDGSVHRARGSVSVCAAAAESVKVACDRVEVT